MQYYQSLVSKYPYYNYHFPNDKLPPMPIIDTKELSEKDSIVKLDGSVEVRLKFE